MVGLYPLFEGRHSLKHNIWSIVKDITGKEHPAKHHSSTAVFEGKEASASGANTPELHEKAAAEEKSVPVLEG
jgi:urea-proton symporter